MRRLQNIAIPDEGVALEVSEGLLIRMSLRSESRGGDRIEEVLRVENDGRTLGELPEAVDRSDSTSNPVVSILFSEHRGRFAVFGGPTLYILSVSGGVEQSFDLFREQRDEEYWSSKLVEVEEGLLVVYEVGVFLLSADLQLTWSRRKFINDFFVGVGNGEATFLEDHQRRWSITLQTGVVKS